MRRYSPEVARFACWLASRRLTYSSPLPVGGRRFVDREGGMRGALRLGEVLVLAVPDAQGPRDQGDERPVVPTGGQVAEQRQQQLREAGVARAHQTEQCDVQAVEHAPELVVAQASPRLLDDGL